MSLWGKLLGPISGVRKLAIEILETTETRMEKAIDSLKRDLSHLRTGRANVSVLDGITVEYYGTPTPLNQVANVSAPEPRLVVVQPWDKSIISEIEKAIQKSDLGINPSNDGTVVRIPFPQLTQETREDIAKQAKAKGEDAKVAVRNIRRDANDQIKKLEKNKELAEDESKTYQDDIQKLTDSTIEKIDKAVSEKEKDIMTI